MMTLNFSHFLGALGGEQSLVAAAAQNKLTLQQQIGLLDGDIHMLIKPQLRTKNILSVAAAARI